MLTFDDGPAAGTTGQVLDALKRECVRASFFLLGRSALAYPELARRAVSEGHTVAHHTFSHPLLDRMPAAAAEAEIDRGFAAVDADALRPRRPRPAHAVLPLSRICLVPRPARPAGTAWHRGVRRGPMGERLGSDVAASSSFSSSIGRVEANRGGIVLFHDTKKQTAAMLPAFLQFLKKGGYRVVHVVAAKP